MIKTEDSSFLRDEESNALINTNVQKYQEYKMQRERNKKLIFLEQEIEKLKNELSDIRNFITTLKDQN